MTQFIRKGKKLLGRP